MAQPAFTSSEIWVGSWDIWREQVVEVIRVGFPEVLQDIAADDIDGEAWRPLFDRGHSPEAAVDDAFLRNVSV